MPLSMYQASVPVFRLSAWRRGAAFSSKAASIWKKAAS